MTDNELLEQSFAIAWNALDMAGDLGHHGDAARHLVSTIERMMRRGEKRRLLLSNAAIDAYRDRYRPLTLVAC